MYKNYKTLSKEFKYGATKGKAGGYYEYKKTRAHIEGNFLYSFNTPICARINDMFILNDYRYSRTTAKLSNILYHVVNDSTFHSYWTGAENYDDGRGAKDKYIADGMEDFINEYVKRGGDIDKAAELLDDTYYIRKHEFYAAHGIITHLSDGQIWYVKRAFTDDILREKRGAISLYRRAIQSGNRTYKAALDIIKFMKDDGAQLFKKLRLKLLFTDENAWIDFDNPDRAIFDAARDMFLNKFYHIPREKRLNEIADDWTAHNEREVRKYVK